jgi:general secretion pathway protein D
VVKQGEFYKILPSKDAQKQGVQVGIGRDIDTPDSPDRMAIQIIPLKYVPSAEVVKVIKPFSSKNGEMVEFTKTNIIILFDTAANIQKIVTLVNVIDSDAFENNEIRFFKVKNANVLDLAKELEGIYTSLGIEKADGKKGVGLAVVPVERASIVVAVSPIPGVLDQMQHWVDVLDTIDKDADEQIFIYFVENGKSEEIADILVQLYGGEASSSLSEKRSQRGQGRSRDSSSKWSSASGSRRSSSSGTGDDSRSSSSSRTRSSATSPKAKTSTILENNIMIVTDEATNSIIVRSNSQDYAKIRETIQRLDIIPRQVLIEVFIGEVGLSGDTQFGVEWALLQNNDKLGGYKGTGKTGQNFGAGLDAALNPANTAAVGFTYLFQSDRLQAFLIAQASNNKLNILSTPNIIASDNKEARIEVGEEVPIVTSEYVPLYTGFDGGTGTGGNNFNSTSRSIEYRNTGIILEVTPRINEKGLVALDISQEVSKAQPITESGIQSPTITNRLAETSVVVQDGKTVVIGGIINNEGSSTQSGIPYLSKIPLLGYFFSNTNDKDSKRELIIMLTPHVIKDIGEASAVTDEYRSKMTEIRKLLLRDEGKWAKSYQ